MKKVIRKIQDAFKRPISASHPWMGDMGASIVWSVLLFVAVLAVSFYLKLGTFNCAPEPVASTNQQPQLRLNLEL